MNFWRSKRALAIRTGLRIFLGGVFIYAAWLKLREPWMLFAMSVDAYGLLPQWAVIAVARALPWAELLLGLVLLSGKWVRVSAAAAATLLLGFMSAMSFSYVKGMRIECGCFGSGDIISPLTLARDGGLLAAALLLALLSFQWGGSPTGPTSSSAASTPPSRPPDTAARREL